MSVTNPAPDVPGIIGRFALRMLVDGELVEASGRETRPVEDPSTGELVAEVPEGSDADVDRAVRAGARAQPAWEALGVEGRAQHLRALADALEQRFEDLILLDVVDSGNPLDAMRFDLRYSIESARAWPALVRWHGGRTIPATPHGLHYTTSMPYGVVGRITAFNHPLMFAVTRILASLMAGNSVVLKPSEQTPLGTLALAELAREVFPPGVLNVISGGADTGRALVAHPDVKRLGFTGSAGTGRMIQREAAEVAVKQLSLELGGKNAMIVLPDVDPQAAVEMAVFGMNLTMCQGQSCGSNSRTFVHRDVYEPFLEALRARIEALRVGPAYDPGTDMGPLVSARHHERVAGFVAGARRDGARLIAGGGRPDGDLPGGGHYLAPTAFADVDPGMRIAREEIFGPVMSVLPWSGLDEVVERANDSELGLTAGIHTHDLDLAHHLAARLQAGYVWINDQAKHFFGTPFGGMKQSGIGREESIEEYESFREQKVVHTMLGDPAAALARMTGGPAA
jgi:betaine-aldehyde dehydrogenase